MNKKYITFSDALVDILADVCGNEFHIATKSKRKIDYWESHMEQFIKLYNRLQDDESKETFLKLVRFEMGSVLSGKAIHEKYALITNAEWNKYCQAATDVKHVPNDYLSDRIETFILEGYNYNGICCAREGDVVFDCGANTGNTAIFFAEQVGRTGSVFSFEPIPSLYAELKRNITEMGYENVIRVVNRACTDCTKTVSFEVNGAASRITKSGMEIKAVSLDDYVKENGIEKVDFIKMDIEGAEMDALAGCKEICLRDFPSMAICIYHKISDYINIPTKLLELNPTYGFYIKHNSNSFSETVLFAVPNCGDSTRIAVEEREVERARNLMIVFNRLYEEKNNSLIGKLYVKLLKLYTDNEELLPSGFKSLCRKMHRNNLIG